MNPARLGIVLFALLALPASVAAQDDDRSADKRIVTVMSRNVYHGVNAEILAIAGATSPLDLLNRVAAVYNGYYARNFSERAVALAAEIEATQPDLIGLQEAALVRIGPAFDPAPATTVALDYVDILLQALAARGLQYAMVVQSIGLDAELPSSLGLDVRHTDREVILARTDLRTSEMKLSNAQAGNFQVSCPFPGPLGSPPIPIVRGWASVDAKVRGKEFRFITTHLDGDCTRVTTFYQDTQAAEILAGPAATDRPVIYVGDLNSEADGGGTATYARALAAGFSDAWAIAGSGAGLTCCQADHVLNPVSLLTERIDFVLFRGDFAVHSVEVVGDEPVDRTPSGLWPSDHAGVVAQLEVPLH